MFLRCLYIDEVTFRQILFFKLLILFCYNFIKNYLKFEVSQIKQIYLYNDYNQQQKILRMLRVHMYICMYISYITMYLSMIFL